MVVGPLVGRKRLAHLHAESGFRVADGIIGEGLCHFGVSLSGSGVLHPVGMPRRKEVVIDLCYDLFCYLAQVTETFCFDSFLVDDDTLPPATRVMCPVNVCGSVEPASVVKIQD